MYHTSKKPSPYNYALQGRYGHYSKGRQTGKYQNQNWAEGATKFDQIKRQNRQRSTQRSTSSDRQSYTSRSSIRIELKEVRTQKSQIKNHFRFEKIKIHASYEPILIEKLQKLLNEQFGGVRNLSKSRQSRPGQLILQLGFETDHGAYRALRGNIQRLLMLVYGKTEVILARPTQQFLRWLSKNTDQIKIQVRNQSPSLSSSSKRSSIDKRTYRYNINIRQQSYGRGQQSPSHSYSSFKVQVRSQSSSSSGSRKSSRYQRTRRYIRQQSLRRDQPYRSNSHSSDRSSRLSNRSLNKNSNQSFSRDRSRQRIRPNHVGKSSERYHNRAESYRRSEDTYNPRPNLFGRSLYQSPKKSTIQTKVSLSLSQTYSQQNASPKTNQNKTLLFLGLHSSINAKNLSNYLKFHPKGCLKPESQFKWKKLNNSSNCQVLQGTFEQLNAQKLLQFGDQLEIYGRPFIVIDCQLSDRQKIIQKISEYQVNIKLPTVIEPYYLMKNLLRCGKVIQIISNQQFTQSGLSDDFNVTFSSKQVCQKLKLLKKTQKGIMIDQVKSQDSFVPIYRPTNKVELKCNKKDEMTKKQQIFEGEIQIQPQFSVMSSRREPEESSMQLQFTQSEKELQQTKKIKDQSSQYLKLGRKKSQS